MTIKLRKASDSADSKKVEHVKPTEASTPVKNVKVKSNTTVTVTNSCEGVSNTLTFSQFRITGNLNQKSYSADYMRRDDQVLCLRNEQKRLLEGRTEPTLDGTKRLREAVNADNSSVVSDAKSVDEDEEIRKREAELDEGAESKVIVLQLGSRNIRIGLALDEMPLSIPSVVAYRKSNSQVSTPRVDLETIVEEFEACYLGIRDELRLRLKSSQIRPASNVKNTILEYNIMQKLEVIENDHDPYEWTDLTDKPAELYGEDVLLIPEQNANEYLIKHPLICGEFNESDYDSAEQTITDISKLISFALFNKLEIKRSQLSQYSIVLIIPDLFVKSQTLALMRLVFDELGITRLMLLQTSLCATFGAGLSSAVVVDIGAQKTSVSCVDEGLVIPGSRIDLKYGGDDITVLLTKLLLRTGIELPLLDLSIPCHWLTMDMLKQQLTSLNVSDCVMRIENMLVRTNQSTRSCRFKIYDDHIIAAMKKLQNKFKLFKRTEDIYEGISTEIESKAQNLQGQPQDSDVQATSLQTHVVWPLDNSILQSISAATEGGILSERERNLYQNIFLIGGSSQMNGLAGYLQEKLENPNMSVNIVPPPRNIDPQHLAWKGASVFNLIKASADYWINREEWEKLGYRILQYKPFGLIFE